jgi:site-specific DNA-cytosine methylase
MDEVLRTVKQQIARLGLTVKDAAEQIGVTAASLERHLGGSYVRSDSLARYRGWLQGRHATNKPTRAVFPDLPFPPDEPERTATLQPLDFTCPAFHRDHPFNVVDLFSGCGGMSLGFDLLDADTIAPEAATSEQRVFQTVLAVDIEEKVVALQNQNHPAGGLLQGSPGRWVDVADLLGPTEILAYYLDHLATRKGEAGLRRALDQMRPLGLAELKEILRGIDARFLATLGDIRASACFRHEYGAIDAVVFGQTSIVGFHEALGLPETSTSRSRLGPRPWAEHGDATAAAPVPEYQHLDGFPEALAVATARLSAAWAAEVGKLETRTAGKGRGQLASSAGRIRRFIDFLASEPMEQVKAAWLYWRATRDALRQIAFGPESVEAYLRTLYTGNRRVDVLLGGPPCQGFSRIGRGKIRSLREDHVHVETDSEAGDVRNLLLLKYVEFISALEPRLFLFENVRHFQASVQTPEGTFQATEVLNEAIQELSHRRLSYRVQDGIVDCSRHLIPQTRERFVMVGVRSDLEVSAIDPALLPGWCLTLPVREQVPLRVALAGLPAPLPAKGQRSGDEAGVSATVAVDPMVAPEDGSVSAYLHWIRQEAPQGFPGRSNNRVDAHHIREPRPDDQAFFELLGAGRRWMDYRCDDSSTLHALQRLIACARDIAGADDGMSALTEAIAAVESTLDGSLSLRLLLECIPPREGELHHHLLAPGYLAKKEGNNGDWIARLHPDRPCKTIVSHMAKDTYAYVHPSEPRTLSVREAARIQTFPDWFRFGSLGLVDTFRAVGNAVPPLLSHQFACKVARLLWADECTRGQRASA